MTIRLEGGPLEARGIHRLFEWAIESQEPPYFCANVDDVWEHYVCADPFEDHSLYIYAGHCTTEEHPHGTPHDL